MSNLYENEMKLEFASKSNNEAFARITVAAFASQLDPTIEELADIKTAVSEAVTNCIIHGYENADGVVKINAKIFDNTLEVENENVYMFWGLATLWNLILKTFFSFYTHTLVD